MHNASYIIVYEYYVQSNMLCTWYDYITLIWVHIEVVVDIKRASLVDQENIDEGALDLAAENSVFLILLTIQILTFSPIPPDYEMILKRTSSEKTLSHFHY